MTLDPQCRQLLEKLEASGIPPYETVEPVVARKLYQRACEGSRGSPPAPFEISTLAIPGPATQLPAVVYRATDKTDLPVLVYFHGGGFTIGSTSSHDSVCRHLCVEANCIVVSVDYRLAPEHKFPAALDDAYAATRWIAENAGALGGDPGRIAVGGDSAGGNLSAVVCLLARDSAGPDLCFQLLIYPGTDMTESFPSHRTFGEGYLLTSSLLSWFHDNYTPADMDHRDWRVSPLHAQSHAGLPPAHIITAGFDPLQDEGKAYAEKLEASGVPVSFRHYEGMLHGFITQYAYVDQARAALSDCAARLAAAFRKQ